MSSEVRITQEEQNYLKSIELLGEQIGQAYQESKSLKFPKTYSQVNQIVTCGMGGSQLGVDVLRHLFGKNLKIPLIQVRGYSLPKFVDQKTLVFLLSYSGSTEEVLSMAKEAIKLKAKCIVISVGGKLKKIIEKNHLPAYIFNPINNPSGQPRMGQGYLLGSILAILKNLRLLEVTDNQLNKMCPIQCPMSKLELNKLSLKLKNKIPVIIASEYLQGCAHVMSNQINESSKQYAVYYSIPEINHHLMEGLTFPKENKKLLHFLFFNSTDYHPRNQKRYQITQQVLTKQKISYTQLEFKGDRVAQALAMLSLGSYLSYYLSKINKVNPNAIPWVNFFKSKMK